MILSIFALQLYLEQFAGDKGAAMDFAKSQGISTIEIFDSELKDMTLPDYCSLAQDHGLTISTVIRMSGFPVRSEEEYREEITRIQALIDDVAKANIKMIMIVPMADYVKNDDDKLFMRDRIIQGMQEVVEYAKGKDVAIMTENFSRADFPFGTIEEMRYILDHVPGLLYNFDTGNFYFRDSNVLEAYDTLKDRIINIHIKDWKNAENGEFVLPCLPRFTGAAIGEGVLPMKELLAKLKADGYAGQLVVEINPVAETTEMIEESVAFIKAQM